jgi:predicted acylesterase/phospholipase RssA
MNSSVTKIGLALSGGGFRASLFHIGVLAALAESEILKAVEVISCVSGGSIIGAYYHLHLKMLLETKTDQQIENQDYVNIIKKIEVDFLKAVQKNIRVRAFMNFLKNIKMVTEKYSRSDRMAELYDAMLYNQFADYLNKKPGELVLMTDLFINPKGYSGSKKFDLREENKERTNKVPMIILNSTTLNTGRNWQFTAVCMGEHETDDKEYNRHNIFKSVRYDEKILNQEKLTKYKRVPLSIAVAASACVPGIFAPLALTNVYPDVTPLLVDGGVYDNQGTAAINYEKCNDIIISDASGVMDFVSKPGNSLLNVLSRTNSILMDRIRNQGLSIPDIKKQANIVKNLKIMHLKKGLEVEHLEPGSEKFKASKAAVHTDYGIVKKIQEKIADVRTDLDAFTNLESFSLMYSGYRMTCKLLDANFRFDEKKWNFGTVKDYLTGAQINQDYDKQLKFSKFKLFKAYLLMPHLIPLGLLIILTSLAPLYIVYYFTPSEYLNNNTLIFLLSIVLLFLIIKFFGIKFVKNLLAIKALNILLTILIAPFVSILSSLYIVLVNRFYISKGRIQ